MRALLRCFRSSSIMEPMRTLIHWLLASLSLIVTGYVVPGVEVRNFAAALLAAVVVGLVNTFIWPVLVFLTLPITVVTFGLFLFVANGLALTQLTPADMATLDRSQRRACRMFLQFS